MKTRSLLLLLLLAGSQGGRATPFRNDLLHLGALPMHASRAQLMQRLGQPATTSRPRYECGTYADEPGKTFYLLHYPQATYVGSAAVGYELQTVHFAPGGAVLRYGPHVWNAATTLAAVRRLFGADAQLDNLPAKGTVQLSIPFVNPRTNQLTESYAHLTFHNGRLTAFEFWSNDC